MLVSRMLNKVYNHIKIFILLNFLILPIFYDELLTNIFPSIPLYMHKTFFYCLHS